MMISFKDCLEKKRIFRFEPAKQLVDLEIKDAENDLCSAQKEFFVQEKKLDPKLAEDFNNSMILREDADYRRKFSQERAQAVIESAKIFLKAAKEILPKEEMK